ncbi:hypothetical protein BCR36DRAFT_583349 [Piromyces finnis]|uniref:Uncharacterized protein n=1 Tax=Piromyces finnis TaxID=1754191 RepID=A0A1Y1V9Y6_9FUNG|nr:hypothetical protein BCR36DRAFT_583349 [Piromyces finnis]|eukprot:ORX50771.1 hypothetical protein BCR36DRAFT_583349 [Piromyces finnis]
MSTNNLENSSNFVSLHELTVSEGRNEPSISYSIEENHNYISRNSSQNNIDLPRSSERDNHSKLFQFIFKKFNNKKTSTVKYAKLENIQQPEIQASSVLYNDEATSSNKDPANNINNDNSNNINRESTQTQIVININTRDGVFSNLNAKPEVRSSRLPTYFEVTGDYANELDDPNIEVSIGQDFEDYGELLVNGLQVGSWYGYWGTILVSAVFEFIGFIFTFFLTSSHSSKNGSVSGLGIILFKYAICNFPIYDTWFIFFLYILGVLLCIKGFLDYKKIKRIEKIVNSDPERYLESQ